MPALHLAVAGDPRGSPYLTLARRLGVVDRTHFLGYRRDMPHLLRAADLLVFPSRYEACALVLLEAMASGLPVITARTTGGAELIGPDHGIILDDPNDATALARALQSLTADAPRRQAMGRAARAVAEQHSFAAMASRYLDVMEEAGGEGLSRRDHAPHPRLCHAGRRQQ